MIKQLQAYWVRVVRYGGLMGEADSYATFGLMAHDLAEAERIATDGGGENRHASGVINLRVFHQAAVCPDHSTQFVDVVPCGTLLYWGRDILGNWNWQAFRGWCAAGAHVVDLNPSDITEEMIAAAVLEVGRV